LQSAVAAFQPSRILTLVRAEHVSFSDLPVLLPRRLVGSKIVDAERVVLRLVCKLAHAFLLRQVELGDQADEPKGPRPGAEGEGGEAGSGNLGVPGVTTRTLEYEWVTPEGKKGKNVHKRKRIVGEAGDVIVHRY
jgi:platelet-activating factor acetylhydrolase